jgi:HEAT repeats
MNKTKKRGIFQNKIKTSLLTETSMKKTFKVAIALIAVLSLFPRTSQAANNIDSLLTQLENSETIESQIETKQAIKELILIDNKAANTALAESFNNNKSSNYRCSLIDALSSSEDSNISEKMSAHINSKDDSIRLCASKSASQNNSEATINALFANIESYKMNSLNKGPYEENLKAKLAAIDSIWSLGEIGNPAIISRLAKLYTTSDEVLKVNIVISIGKTKSPEAIKILEKITKSQEAAILKATAWEMIDYANGVEE